jgi:hypothetical protein
VFLRAQQQIEGRRRPRLAGLAIQRQKSETTGGIVLIPRGVIELPQIRSPIDAKICGIAKPLRVMRLTRLEKYIAKIP